jgi:hypothetical protein
MGAKYRGKSAFSATYTAIVSKFGFEHSQRLRFASQAQPLSEAGHVQEHGRCTMLQR